MFSVLQSGFLIMTRVCRNREKFRTDEQKKTTADVTGQLPIIYGSALSRSNHCPLYFCPHQLVLVTLRGLQEEDDIYHFAPAQVVISAGPMQTGPFVFRHINANMNWSHKTCHISVSYSFHLSCKVLEMLWKQIIQTSGDVAHSYKWKMYWILFIDCCFPFSSLICTAWVYAKMLLKPLLNFPVILTRHNSCSIEASLIQNCLHD